MSKVPHTSIQRNFNLDNFFGLSREILSREILSKFLWTSHSSEKFSPTFSSLHEKNFAGVRNLLIKFLRRVQISLQIFSIQRNFSPNFSGVQTKTIIKCLISVISEKDKKNFPLGNRFSRKIENLNHEI